MNKPKRVKKDFERPFYYFGLDLARVTALPVYLWLRPKWVYVTPAAKKRQRGGVLLVANHVSYTDPFAMYLALWYRRLHLLAADIVFRHRFLGALMRFGRVICIRREGVDYAAFRRMAELLSGGKAVGMFPEGHIRRTPEEGVDSFKSGAAMLALRTGVPVVPLYIERREHALSRQVMYIGEAVNLRATFGPGPYTSEDVAKAALLLQKKEAELADCARAAAEKKARRKTDRQAH